MWVGGRQILRKTQVLKFWDDLQRDTAAAAVRKFKNQDGYASERTLNRYVQAERGFREDVPIEELSAKIGWGLAYLKKLRTWWDDSHTPSSPVENDLAIFQRVLVLQGSEHAKELRDEALRLIRELDKPLEHLLGLFCLPALPRFNLELGDGVEAFGGSPMPAALRSHNPSNGIWDLLQQLTKGLRGMKSQWEPLCSWVEHHPEVGPRIQVLKPKESVKRTPGFTDSFAKTIVLASLTDADFERSEDYLEGLCEVEYKIQNPDPLYALTWDSYESHVIAVDGNAKSWELWKRLHMDLRFEMRETSLLGELLSSCRESSRLRTEITNELNRLARLPFSGDCGLCRDWS